MDADQRRLDNPFSMDEQCTNCDELPETRTQVVHGYGDVGGEFLVVGESPSEAADRTGVPFTGDAAGERLQRVLGELGFSRSPPDETDPDLQNVFLTYLARCRHHTRDPTNGEVLNCDPFLTAEIRMINPHIIVPVGERVLKALAAEYTTRSPESFDIDSAHATTIRGRGFELVPMLALDSQTDADTEAFIDHIRDSVFARDYRQTKGRRSR